MQSVQFSLFLKLDFHENKVLTLKQEINECTYPPEGVSLIFKTEYSTLSQFLLEANILTFLILITNTENFQIYCVKSGVGK